jgi:benzodiazapine receptor
VFAPVWTVLYAMIAVSGWLIWRLGRPQSYRALRLWGWQLLFNALWSPAFFGLHRPGLGLAVILVLMLLLAATMWRFAQQSRLAAALLLPYFAWSAYATYLTAGFFDLNGR